MEMKAMQPCLMAITKASGTKQAALVLAFGAGSKKQGREKQCHGLSKVSPVSPIG